MYSLKTLTMKTLIMLCVLIAASTVMLTVHPALAASPIITLIAPTEAAAPDSARPTFTWQLEPQTEGVTYSIVIRELDLSSPMRVGKVVFEQAGIREASLPYPATMPSLDGEHAYVWTVQAFDSTGKSIGKSNPALLTNLLPWSFCWLFPWPPSLNVCGIGNSFSLTALAFMVPGSGIYNWTLTNVGTAASQSGTSSSGYMTIPVPTGLLPTTAGTHTYTLNVTRGGCSRTVTFTVNVFLNTALVMDYPSGTPISQICVAGADATLNVPNLPVGYTVTWDWKDYTNSAGGPWTGAGTGSLGTGNPKNTNAITPNCAASAGGAPSYVTRWFRATISGGAWPCGPIFVPLKVWCPTVAGTVSTAQTQICSNNAYPIPVTLNLGGQIVGTIGNWTRSPGSIPPNTGLNQITDSITLAGTYIYTVAVQNGTCSSQTASITIKVEDPITATVTGTTHEVCPNDDADLDVTHSGPPGSTIQWQYQVNCTGSWIDSGVTSTHQNTNAIGDLGPYSPPPTQSICWRAIISSPSGICPPAISNTWSINIIQRPCVPTIAVAGNLPKCPGSPVTLQASTTCGTGPFTWQWYLNGVLQSGSGSSYVATLPGHYTVKVFNKNQCDSATSLPVTITDCVNLVTIKGPCSTNGTTIITLTAEPDSQPNPPPQLSVPCGGPYTYVWSTGATTASITATPTTTTTYSVTVTDGLGCETTATFTVKVCPAP